MSKIPICPLGSGVSLVCDQSMEISSFSETNETGRKRQLSDKDGFEKPRKPAKLKVKAKQKPIETGNMFDGLRCSQAGH